jgi:aldose 1-epimerase
VSPDTTYGVQRGQVAGFESWTLRSVDGALESTWVPAAGMLGCSLAHRGEELLHLGRSVADYARTHSTMGIPLLYPWANRLSAWEYSFRGREVVLDRDSPLLKTDPNGLPIHGSLAASPHWSVVSADADEERASLVAELDFASHDDLLATFPFPHRLSIQVRLAGSELTIETTVEPIGDAPVPVSFGFHPYFRLPSVASSEWLVELPVRKRLELDGQMIPTGGTESFAFPCQELGDRSFDDGFTDLEPGRPFRLAGAGREVAVTFGERFPWAQVYRPANADFICFEPMTAPTNALVSGDSLPTVAPGDSFAAAFTIAVKEAPPRP